MTIFTNLAAVLGGLVVFGDPLGSSPALAAVHALAFGVAGVAAWLLARAHARIAGRGSLRAKQAGETVSGGAPSPWRLPQSKCARSWSSTSSS